MASVNFEKLKSATEVKRMFKHCDKAERIKDNHANEQIDKAKTSQNSQFRYSYSDTCKRYDDRIAYLDSLEGANKRKDRVTCFGLCVPTPVGLSQSDEQAWFSKVNKLIKAQYGAENVMNCYIHRDEEHEYKNAETGEDCVSRAHAHFYVIPAIDGKLNGKKFSSKANMIKLNESIQDMTEADYGLQFMDGTKRKSKKSVEQLKQESRAREIEDSAKQKAAEIIANAQKEAIRRREAINKAESDLQQRRRLLDEKEEKLHARELELDKKLSEALQIKADAEREKAKYAKLNQYSEPEQQGITKNIQNNQAIRRYDKGDLGF